MRVNKNQLGIIYAKNGTGAGTYVDVVGVTQAKGVLTTSATEQSTTPLGPVDYSHPFTGARQALSLFVKIALSASTAIVVQLQGRSGIGEAWADLQLVRQDTGVVQAQHSLVAGDYILQTSSTLSVGQIRVVAAASGAPAVGDEITVSGTFAN